MRTAAVVSLFLSNQGCACVSKDISHLLTQALSFPVSPQCLPVVSYGCKFFITEAGFVCALTDWLRTLHVQEKSKKYINSRDQDLELTFTLKMQSKLTLHINWFEKEKIIEEQKLPCLWWRNSVQKWMTGSKCWQAKWRLKFRSD